MKYTVTPELATLIKTLRAQNGVSAKDLAEEIGRSRSYVSKLESGNIKNIDSGLLKRVLSIAANSPDFYGNVLPSSVKLLSSTLDANAMINQTWLINLDVLERIVPISPKMAQNIRNTMESIGLTSAKLAKIANANIDSQASSTAPENMFYVETVAGQGRLLARTHINEDVVEDIVSGKINETDYFTLYTICHSMFRAQLYPAATTKLPPHQAVTLLRTVADYMDRWGVHSLIGYSHFLSSDEFVAHQSPLSHSETDMFDRLAAQLRTISDYDENRTIAQVNSFNETLQWDPSFALALMEIPFSQLGEMSYSNKRQMLSEIREVVNSFASVDAIIRKLERYD